LNTMGYSGPELLNRLDGEPARWRSTVPDLLWAAYSRLATMVERDFWVNRQRLRRHGVGSGATLG
jgi:hypothetical protein